MVVPIGGEWVWERYWEVYQPEKTQYQEIAAYALLTGVRFEPWEIDALRAMDDVRVSYKPQRSREDDRA